MMAAVLPVEGEEAVDVQLIRRRMQQGIPPQDVQEYLWRVRLEAEGIPDVVVAPDVDPRQFDAQQTSNMPKLQAFGLEQTDPARIPDSKWTRGLLADFAELRQLISRWEVIGPPKAETVQDTDVPVEILRTTVPRMSDEEGWIRFFFGKPGTDTSATPPHLRLLLQFDQVLTRRLLEYHAAWLSSEDMGQVSRARAVWIYALLARLDKPVHANVAATIRQILRCCWTLRCELEAPSEIQLKSLNILIVIAGDFFGQLHDLEAQVLTKSKEELLESMTPSIFPNINPRGGSKDFPDLIGINSTPSSMKSTELSPLKRSEQEFLQHTARQRITTYDGHTWEYYDSGRLSDANAGLPPLVCLPGTSGVARCFHLQLQELGAKGFRVLAIQYPVIWTHEEWIHSFDRFLNSMNLSERYMSLYPQRVVSLAMTQGFCDTHAFGASAPCIKMYILEQFPKQTPDMDAQNQAIDYMLEQLGSLTQQDIASRLTLSCLSCDPKSWKIFLPDEKISLIDSYEDTSLPASLKDQLGCRYPRAKQALLKNGGDFPFLSHHEEVTMHLQVHLRANGVFIA
ncbi:Maspardin [Phytophthora citrophthora]|uniref:Maspardin n=1 Tax=Phytophthora citrophthora TaxID=4793 RepID=A0AAD9LRL0_9STRA|nr:Maspardin [Phytophthora citrophthora]